STGDELYKYNADNAAAGIKLVKDIAAGAASPEPANLTAVGSNLYFTITAASNQQLYITDGTEGGTKLVKDLGTLTPYDVFNLAAANDKLLFTVFTPTNGNEPWKSDGTAVGTKMIKDIFPGYLSSLPQAFTYFKNGESLFSATDGKKGVELWKTDGTTAGTILLKNINTTTTGSSNPELRINTGVLNNKLFFSASNPQHPAALYLSDGTAAGTKMLDLNNGNSPGAADFTVFKNHIYFSAFGNGVVSVYKSDGTASGTKALFNAGSGALGVAKIIAAQDYFFVFYDDYDHNNTQLWVSDGTAAGSKLVQVIPFQSIYDGAATGNTICFSGYDAVHGSELWKATNAPGSAALLKDIVPGAQGSSISYFAVYNNKVYFTARDASNTAYIYLTNGTAAGTKKLFNTSVQQSPLVVANNKLFFTGNDATFGATLFCSSGTAATTKTVKDKIFGKPLSYPDYLTVFNNKVFCTASDSAYGTELFKTDGTNAGTTVVKDMVAGTYSSYPSQLTVGSGALYFRMSDASYYNQLWVTDGTAAGTQQVTDAAFTGITFNTMIGTSDKLFLNAYTYAYGYELYAGSASLQKPAISKASKNSMAGTGTFTATIMGNPITDRINLSVYNTKPQMCWITLADGAGKILFIKKEFIPAGVNSISYPAESLASGVYGLKITAADGSSVSLKIIK
ncbi:MAG TPA: hypothetical protein VHB70_19400, partial [Parafilimonas sp.]|nr:hypothetical protein [Parafilimonas sp.]